MSPLLQADTHEHALALGPLHAQIQLAMVHFAEQPTPIPLAVTQVALQLPATHSEVHPLPAHFDTHRLLLQEAAVGELALAGVEEAVHERPEHWAVHPSPRHVL